MLLVAAVVVGLLAAGGPRGPAAAPAPVLLAAGDIASCVSDGDEQTAALVERTPGAVAALGDLAYDRGTAEEFAACYDPSWGRFKARTRPALGNHEYGTAGAAGYFDYFGPTVGKRDRGYYTYRLGAWRIIVLNSNCAPAGGCTTSSPQVRWLRAVLRAHRARCTLAYWHHPRFSSGLHGDDPTVAPFWAELYAAGAEVVLGGHDHDYERFAPLDPSGRLDARRGIRQFVVGTGGRSHYPIVRRARGSRVREWRTFGVLRLTLRPDGFDWRFLPVAGARFTDSGSGRCH